MLDDDPTGTQTVRGVPVLFDPSVDALAGVLASRAPLAFVSTNSRSLPEDRAVALARRLGRRIRSASRRTGRPVELVSRSDSTLRGHFPAEVDTLAEAFGIPMAPVLLMPYFGDGGRITVGGVHYLVRDDVPTPVAETEYARDPAFAYTESHLARWASARPGFGDRPIVPLPIQLIRSGGPDAVASLLTAAPLGAIVIADATDDRDAEVVAAGVVAAEKTRPIVARTAASYVRARLGQTRHADLGATDLRLPAGPGLLVVGSHVPMTTRQLEQLLADPPVALELVELPAEAALDGRTAGRATREARATAVTLLARGVTPILSTTRRRLDAPDDASGLSLGARVSRMLVGAMRDLSPAPDWVLAKGGITSSDVATRGLRAQSATVLGQLLPGVPVWRVRPVTGGPVVLVVFPGNVGGPDDLRMAVEALSRGRSGTAPGTTDARRAGAS